MVMADRPCLPVEFANNRETQIGNTTLGRQVGDGVGAWPLGFG